MIRTWPAPVLRRLASGLAGLALPVLLALPAAAALAQEVVRVSGTGSGTGGMQLLAAAYMQTHPGVVIEVPTAMGSNGGISALLDRRLDIALSNRAPNEKELAQRAVVATEYARTPFVIAVHRSVGVSGLASRELAGLYGEGAVSFPNGKRARPVLRLSDATDTRLLKAISADVAAAIDAIGSRRGMLHANTDSETADLLEKTPGAFAVSTLALIESERRPLVALAIDGVAPTVANLANGTYRHYKSLFMIVDAQPTPATARFAAFVRSAEAARLLSAHGHWVR